MSGDESLLTVLYQPIYHLKSKTLAGYEALSRLVDDEGHYISPLEFIPILKQLGVMVPFGKALLKQVCEFIKLLNNPSFTVIINADVEELEAAGYAENLIETLSKHHI